MMYMDAQIAHNNLMQRYKPRGFVFNVIKKKKTFEEKLYIENFTLIAYSWILEENV